MARENNNLIYQPKRSRARQEKVNSLLKNLAASFLSRETIGAIVAIIRVETSKDLSPCGRSPKGRKSAKIFISIFPETKEKEVLDLMNGKKSDLRKYIGSQIRMKFLPALEFEIDKGEKSRKRIEELLNGPVALPAGDVPKGQK
jgi:ribosome-binding factor A